MKIEPAAKEALGADQNRVQSQAKYSYPSVI